MTRPAPRSLVMLLGGALAAAIPALSSGCALETADENDTTLAGDLTGDASVQVTIDENALTPLEPGFIGYNSAMVWGAVSYLDPNLQAMAAPLGVGWLRYPAGTGSDAFDWSTGQVRSNWANAFPGSHRQDFQRELKLLAARGGELTGLRVDDMSNLVGAIDAQGIIVCVNGFTDTPASAKAFAAYAKSHGIRVLAWELSNEPYYFPSFFKSAKDYLDKMKPYASAIKQADPEAVVSVFASDAGKPSSSWDSALHTYPDKYWGAVSFHHYPKLKGLPSTNAAIEVLDEELATKTTGYVNGHLGHYVGTKTPVLITEFDPSTGDGKGGVVGTLYGGIYAAEYALRMARAPQVKHVGAHALVNDAGIDVTNNHASDLMTAYQNHTTIDTTTLDFGFFVSAQATAYAVAGVAAAGATHTASTTVSGGGTAPLPGGKSMPAVFAQAFKSGGETRLVLTNKGDHAETVAIADAAHLATGSLRVVTVTAADKLAANSSSQSPVSAKTTTLSGTVTLPAYSVVSVTW